MIYFKRQLTSEEKSRPYSKYFYRQPVQPEPEALAAMANPIDPSKALLLENLNDMLNPGYSKVESGWCILPSGAGYVACYTKMPGVTVDMFSWWFAWHMLENLRYKVWSPKDHLEVHINEKSRARILNPDIPMTEKTHGVTCCVIENIGIGPERIELRFMDPESCGFDMDRFKEPNISMLIASNGTDRMLFPPLGMPNHMGSAFMCHQVRKIPEGIELRTRFWMGEKIIEKKPAHLLPQGISLPPFVPQGLAIHNVYEFANLAALLPDIYREQKGIVA